MSFFCKKNPIMNKKLNSFFTLKENFSTHEPPKPSSHFMSHDRTGRYNKRKKKMRLVFGWRTGMEMDI